MIIISYPERVLPERRLFDQAASEFIVIPEMRLKPMKLKLEHSLMSIRIWEAEHETPFSEIDKMTPEDLIGYIKCMTINRQEDDSVYDQLTAKDLERVSNYIARQNSAWEISRKNGSKRPGRKRKNTVEGIYYTMIQLGIPIDPCEQWHLGSLLALIDYFDRNSGGNAGGKKKSWSEMQAQFLRMNEANRKKYHSRG